MGRVHSFTNKKRSRHGLHKDPFYHSKYYQKNKEKLKQQQRSRYLKSVGGKLKYNKTPQEHAETWNYKNFFDATDSNKNLRLGHRHDGSNVKLPSLLTTEALEQKKFLKVIPYYKDNRNFYESALNGVWQKYKDIKLKQLSVSQLQEIYDSLSEGDKRTWQKYLHTHNMGIVLGVRNSCRNYKIGCADIDSKGYTALFNSKYVSNRVGSVHYYFLYKEQDRKSRSGKNCIRINDFKCDLKFNGYMMAPLSLHSSGNLYRLRGRGQYFIGVFEKASEVYEHLIKTVKEFQHKREIKRQEAIERKMLKCQIEVIPKK